MVVATRSGLRRVRLYLLVADPAFLQGATHTFQYAGSVGVLDAVELFVLPVVSPGVLLRDPDLHIRVSHFQHCSLLLVLPV